MASLSNVFSDVYISGNCTVKGTLSTLGGSITSQWTTVGSGIYYTAGNVGIGTTNPTQALTINATASNIYASTSGSGAYWQYTNTADARRTYVGIDGTGMFSLSAGALALGTDSTPIVFAPSYSGGEKMRISTTGLVGIGTNNPGSLLTVSGGTSLGAGYTTYTAPTNGLIVQGPVGIGVNNPASTSALQVSGNVVTSGFTSNSTNTVFNFDTLSVPFLIATQVSGPTGNAFQVSGNVYATDTIASANPMMFRNRLYNGGMSLWQRATAGTSTAASAYSTADRWCGALGTSGLTLAQSSTVPSGYPFSYSLQVATTTATASTPLIEQRIENVNIPDFVSGTNVTVSFWASQTAGTLMPLSVALYYATAVNSFGTQTLAVAAAQTTPTLTASLTYYVLTFTLNTSLGATNGLALRFTTGATASTGTFLITGVQLEKGSTASPFEVRPYGNELALCQRYYYQIQPTAGFGLFGQGIASSTTGAEIFIQYPVPLRSNVVAVSSSAAANFQWWAIGITTATLTGIALAGDGSGFVHCRLTATYSAAGSAGNPGWLRCVSSGANTTFIGFSCEL